MKPFDANAIRQDFPMLVSGGLTYLDSAASSLTPAPVIEAMDAYYKEYRSNVHRGMYKAAERATAEYEAARAKIARFINASSVETIFTKGATDSLNALAQILGDGLNEGDEIVLTEMEHHANLVPWQEVAKRRGAILKFIPVTPEFTLDMEAARALIGPKTKIVSVAHASNVLGTVNPVTELAALAHGVGAAIVLDSAQSAPHRAIDVRALDCDFLVFSAHKMLGPTGLGILYGRRALLEKLEPYQFGGDMIREVTLTGAEWNDLPWKFEAGTPNIAGAIGFGAAITYMEKLGMEAIEAHDRAITAYAIAKVSAIPGVRIIGLSSVASAKGDPAHTDRVGSVSFDVEGVHPHDLATLLDRENVAVRGGQHCAMPLMAKLGLVAAARASFHVYTTGADVDALAAAIVKASKLFK